MNKVSIGDCILADRGFNIKEGLSALKTTFKVPSFTKGKKQFSGGEVESSRQLSNVRIHEYYINNSVVPI